MYGFTGPCEGLYVNSRSAMHDWQPLRVSSIYRYGVYSGEGVRSKRAEAQRESQRLLAP